MAKLKCTEPGCERTRYIGGKCRAHQEIANICRPSGKQYGGNDAWRELDDRDRLGKPMERVRLTLEPLDALRQHA